MIVYLRLKCKPFLTTSDAPALSTFARSVDEIERLTGGEFEFFPEAPDKVTASYNLADWGL